MSDFAEPTQTLSDELACTGCGAMLKFKPGTHSLACEYCGAQNEIQTPTPPGVVEEIRLDDFLNKTIEREPTMEVSTVKCDSCGATSTLSKGIASDRCPFCASTLVIKTGTTSSLHKPQYVLPFQIDESKALSRFRQWLKDLWFAPSELKHYGDRADKLSGMYLPFWTFDCHTISAYTGQRGVNYTQQVPVTRNQNGKTVTVMQTVTKTRWYPASGKVDHSFDDLLIEATTSLPKDRLRALEPWDTKQFVAYDDKFLSGFRTETYRVDLRSAYTEAKQRMTDHIHALVRQAIGGDQQLVHHVNTTYRDPTFKHVLLPVWISAYRYKGKVYQILINARTGEVQGSRPYSAGKIALAVLGGILLIGLLIWLAN